jgi:transketolase
MRNAFAAALLDAVVDDDSVCLVLADLGWGVFDEVDRLAPGRVINAGIAEQAMVGVAAGLAQAGRKAVVYSIAPFITSRANDQVRVDVAAGNADVTLVGVGGGVAYGYLGLTHHAIDDLATMRALPNLTVLAPCDPAETRAATRAALAHPGPVYLRLGKNGEPPLLAQPAPFAIGRSTAVREGGDITLATTGLMLGEALQAAELLATRGVDASVLHFGTVKPLDVDAVVAALASTHTILTLEEHSVVGGFGSAVAEVAAGVGVGRVVRAGFPDAFVHEVGDRAHLLACHALDAEGIATRATSLLMTPSRVAA